jgi:ATP-binding cassette, subfamily F, member 3
VNERRKVGAGKKARTAPKDERKRQREAQRTLDDAEAAIAELEKRVGALTAALDDPELYTRQGGVDEAGRMGAELERVKRELDAAFERWNSATEAADALSS